MQPAAVVGLFEKRGQHPRRTRKEGGRTPSEVDFDNIRPLPRSTQFSEKGLRFLVVRVVGKISGRGGQWL